MGATGLRLGCRHSNPGQGEKGDFSCVFGTQVRAMLNTYGLAASLSSLLDPAHLQGGVNGPSRTLTDPGGMTVQLLSTRRGPQARVPMFPSAMQQYQSATCATMFHVCDFSPIRFCSASQYYATDGWLIEMGRVVCFFHHNEGCRWLP